MVWWSGDLVVWWSGGPNFDTQMKPRWTSDLFFFGARRPKAIFEANLIRKTSIFNKEICFWKIAIFNLELMGKPILDTQTFLHSSKPSFRYTNFFGSWKPNFRYTNNFRSSKRCFRYTNFFGSLKPNFRYTNYFRSSKPSFRYTNFFA